ncbi:MAG: hypothetical protein RL297_63 [Pseudomonadota bacterium]|jgi:farnesyl diphosphate synthase
MDFNAWLAQQHTEVELALSRALPEGSSADLCQAMRYAVLGGGKRLRPLLVLATAQAVGASTALAMPAACAVEMIHAYSLVHDDMPCMDNDVLRRGKPTVHVRFGQASALLAGDALQAQAFETLLPEDGSVPLTLSARWCRLLAVASGAHGMAGGQAIDLSSVGLALDQTALTQMHRLKTGALLQASVMMGATCVELSDAKTQALSRYGAALGLAFQVVDDILDVTANASSLGKTAGKDAANDKPTFVSLMGLTQAQAHANALLDEAHQALAHTGLPAVERLHQLADWVTRRSH